MRNDSPDKIVLLAAAPDFALGRGFKTSAHPGLLSVRVVRGDGKCQVLTRWQPSQPPDEMLRLAHELKLTPIWSGITTDQRPEPAAWKKLIRPMVLLPALLAILGGFEALRHHYSSLLAAPEFAVHQKSSRTDVLAGTPTDIAWEVRNTSPVGAIRTRIVAATIQAMPEGSSAPLEIEVPPASSAWGARVEPGEGIPEPLPLPALPPGEHLLKVAHEGDAGFFRTRDRLDTHVKVLAWRPHEIIQTRIEPAGARCRLWLELHVGRPCNAGAQFEVMLVSDGSTQLNTPDFYRLSRVKVEVAERSADQTTWLHRLQLPPLDAFSVHPFSIELKGKDRSLKEWEQVAADVISTMSFELL